MAVKLTANAVFVLNAGNDEISVSSTDMSNVDQDKNDFGTSSTTATMSMGSAETGNESAVGEAAAHHVLVE